VTKWVFNYYNENRLTGAIILDTTYGYQIKGTDDKLITLAENVVRDFAVAGVPGAYMVDTLPWRKFAFF
jgi:hypothetical protein